MQAADWIGLGALIVGIISLVFAVLAYKATKSQAETAKDALVKAEEANELSGVANEYSQKANEIANDANKIANDSFKESQKANALSNEANNIATIANSKAATGNQLAGTANSLAERAISKAEEANDIAVKANQIASETSDVRFKISINPGEFTPRLSRQPPIFEPIVSIVHVGFSPAKDLQIEFRIDSISFKEYAKSMKSNDILTISFKNHKKFYEYFRSFYNGLVSDYFKMQYNENSLGVPNQWLSGEMRNPKNMKIIALYTTEAGARKKIEEDVPFEVLTTIMGDEVQKIVVDHTPNIQGSQFQQQRGMLGE